MLVQSLPTVVAGSKECHFSLSPHPLSCSSLDETEVAHLISCSGSKCQLVTNQSERESGDADRRGSQLVQQQPPGSPSHQEGSSFSGVINEGQPREWVQAGHGSPLSSASLAWTSCMGKQLVKPYMVAFMQPVAPLQWISEAITLLNALALSPHLSNQWLNLWQGMQAHFL